MRNAKLGFLLCILSLTFANSAHAEPLKAQDFLNEVKDTYRQMKSFSTIGTVKVNFGEMEIEQEKSFSMMLKKPMRYHIQWFEKSGPLTGDSHAVWNAGKGAYSYWQSLKSYSKEQNDMMAIAGATGISSGIAYNIPTLFFNELMPGNVFDQLTDVKISGKEMLKNEPCIVIEGKDRSSSQKKFWISEKRKIILRETSKGEINSKTTKELLKDDPTKNMTDAQWKDIARAGGLEPTENNIKLLKQQMHEAQKQIPQMDLKYSQENIYSNIVIDEPIEDTKLAFKVPAGTVLKP